MPFPVWLKFCFSPRVLYGSGGLQYVTGRVGSVRVRKCSKCHGSGRVGQEVFESRGSSQAGTIFFQISRVGSGRVGSRFSNLTDRIRSCPARNESLTGRASMTHELASAEPQIGPAHPARGSDTKYARVLAQLKASLQCPYSIILLCYPTPTLKHRHIYIVCPHPSIPTTARRFRDHQTLQHIVRVSDTRLHKQFDP